MGFIMTFSYTGVTALCVNSPFRGFEILEKYKPLFLSLFLSLLPSFLFLMDLLESVEFLAFKLQ